MISSLTGSTLTLGSYPTTKEISQGIQPSLARECRNKDVGAGSVVLQSSYTPMLPNNPSLFFFSSSNCPSALCTSALDAARSGGNP